MSSLGTNVLWRYPGVIEGRLSPPVMSVVPDPGSYYYYYTYFPEYAYGSSYDSSSVFCLGSDEIVLPDVRLPIGAKISVEQQAKIPVDSKLIRFHWHMRMPAGLPQSRDLVLASAVSFKDGSLVQAGDGLQGFVITSPLSQLTANDREQIAQVSGATDVGNNGLFRLSGVPMNIGSVPGGDRAIVENAAFVQRLNDPAVTIRLLGQKWIGRAYLDIGSGWQETFQLQEEAGHTWYRADLAFNVSKHSGTLWIKFELMLEQAT